MRASYVHALKDEGKTRTAISSICYQRLEKRSSLRYLLLRLVIRTFHCLNSEPMPRRRGKGQALANKRARVENHVEPSEPGTFSSNSAPSWNQ